MEWRSFVFRATKRHCRIGFRWKTKWEFNFALLLNAEDEMHMRCLSPDRPVSGFFFVDNAWPGRFLSVHVANSRQKPFPHSFIFERIRRHQHWFSMTQDVNDDDDRQLRCRVGRSESRSVAAAAQLPSPCRFFNKTTTTTTPAPAPQPALHTFAPNVTTPSNTVYVPVFGRTRSWTSRLPPLTAPVRSNRTPSVRRRYRRFSLQYC